MSDGVPGADRPGRRIDLERHRPGLAALLLYLIAALLLTWDAWASPTTQWIGSCCDPEQTFWFLGWIPYAIRHGVDPFVTTQLNAPDAVNLMWNTSIPLWSLLAAPITILAGPILAYNVLLLGAIVASAAAGRLAVGRFVGGTVAPLVGGAVYGFSPYVVSHAILHLDLAMAWLPPLVLVVVHDLLAGRRSPLRSGLLLGLLAVAELLTTEELVLTTAVAAAITLAVLAVQRRSQIRAAIARLAPMLITAAAVGAVLGAWPLAVQFLGPGRISGRLIDTGPYSTDLLNLVFPTRLQLLAPPVATAISDGFSGLYHEADAYLGGPLIVLLGVVVVRGRHDLRVRTAAIVGLALLVLSMGATLRVSGPSTGLPLPWALVAGLPIAEDVIASRFVVFAWLAVAILVGVAIEWSLRVPRREAVPRLVAIGLALLFVLPAPIPSRTATVPDFFVRWSDEGLRPDATVLVAPFFRDGAGADPMLWAAVAGDEPRMPEAYAYVPRPGGQAGYGPAPTQLSQLMEAIQDGTVTIVARGAVRDQVATDLRAKGITDVIVGPMTRDGAMLAFFRDLFGRDPEAVDGVWIWRAVDVRGVSVAP